MRVALTDFEYPPVFCGDGRYRVKPTVEVLGCRGISMTRSAARMLIDHFVARGRSQHSAMGGTVWVVLTFCEHNHIPYTVARVPGEGTAILYERPA